MQAKITHALPDVRDLRTSGNGCYQSLSFLRPRDQKKPEALGTRMFPPGFQAHFQGGVRGSPGTGLKEALLAGCILRAFIIILKARFR